MFFRKILSPLKNIHLQSLIGNGVMAVFGMATWALLYRALSLQDLGIYVFFITAFNLVDMLRIGFLTNPFIKFYSGTSLTRGNEVAGSSWTLALIITGLMILFNIISLLFQSYIENDGILLLLKYFSFISVATLPSFMANLVVQGEKRFDHLLWIRLINQLLFTGSLLTLIFLNKSNLNTILVTFIIANLCTSMATLFLGWTKISTLRNTSRKTIKEIFHFGKYSMGTSVTANFFKVIDTFFINYFLGPAALAIYNLASKLLQIVEMPLLSFAASGFPSLSDHFNNGQKEEMMHVLKKMVGMVSIVIFLIAILSIIFAKPIIMLMGGEKYIETEAVPLLQLFMILSVLYPADRYFALTLDVIHKPKINFYKILIMLVVSIIGVYIAATIFKSIFAVAIVGLFPTLVSIVIAYVNLNRYHKFKFFSVYSVGLAEVILFLKQVFRFFKKGDNDK